MDVLEKVKRDAGLLDIALSADLKRLLIDNATEEKGFSTASLTRKEVMKLAWELREVARKMIET